MRFKTVCYGQGRQRHYLRPAESFGSATAVGFVHGGFWRSEKTPESFAWQMEELASAGVDSFSVGYRTTDLGSVWPAGVEDVVDAARHAKGAFGDARILLVGHSAGGHLTLKAQDRDPSLADVIALAPITDVRQAHELGLGAGAVVELLPSASKHALVDASVDDVSASSPGYRVLIHGAADLTVPVDMSVQYWLRNREFVDLHLLGHARHMDLVKQARPHAVEVLSIIQERAKTR